MLPPQISYVPHFILQPRTSGSELRHTQPHRAESYEPSSQTPSLCLRQSFLPAKSQEHMENEESQDSASIGLSLPATPATHPGTLNTVLPPPYFHWTQHRQ